MPARTSRRGAGHSPGGGVRGDDHAAASPASRPGRAGMGGLNAVSRATPGGGLLVGHHQPDIRNPVSFGACRLVPGRLAEPLFGEMAGHPIGAPFINTKPDAFRCRASRSAVIRAMMSSAVMHPLASRVAEREGQGIGDLAGHGPAEGRLIGHRGTAEDCLEEQERSGRPSPIVAPAATGVRLSRPLNSPVRPRPAPGQCRVPGGHART